MSDHVVAQPGMIGSCRRAPGHRACGSRRRPSTRGLRSGFGYGGLDAPAAAVPLLELPNRDYLVFRAPLLSCPRGHSPVRSCGGQMTAPGSSPLRSPAGASLFWRGTGWPCVPLALRSTPAIDQRPEWSRRAFGQGGVEQRQVALRLNEVGPLSLGPDFPQGRAESFGCPAWSTSVTCT